MATNYRKPWGIAVEPIKQNQIGEIQADGVVTCYATISDSIERPFLAPIGTSGKLKPSWWGSADIVYADISSNGERYVLARLGLLQTPIYKATAKAAISPGSSGNAGLMYGGTERETVTAHFKWMEGAADISSGADMLITWSPDLARWDIVNAEC